MAEAPLDAVAHVASNVSTKEAISVYARQLRSNSAILSLISVTYVLSRPHTPSWLLPAGLAMSAIFAGTSGGFRHGRVSSRSSRRERETQTARVEAVHRIVTLLASLLILDASVHMQVACLRAANGEVKEDINCVIATSAAPPVIFGIAALYLPFFVVVALKVSRVFIFLAARFAVSVGAADVALARWPDLLQLPAAGPPQPSTGSWTHDVRAWLSSKGRLGAVAATLGPHLACGTMFLVYVSFYQAPAPEAREAGSAGVVQRRARRWLDHAAAPSNWMARSLVQGSKQTRRTFLGTSKTLSPEVPTVVALTLCFALGGGPDSMLGGSFSTGGSHLNPQIARTVYAACLGATALLVAHENFAPSAGKARIIRGVEKMEQETFLRKLTTGLVGAPSEAEFLRIAARTVAAMVPDARGAIIVFPSSGAGGPRGSDTEAEDCDASIPFSGEVGLCHIIARDDSEAKEALGNVYVPLSMRDLPTSDGPDWALGTLAVGGCRSSSSLKKTSRDSGGRRTPSEDGDPFGGSGGGGSTRGGSMQRRSSGSAAARSGKPLKSQSMIPMPPLKLVSRGGRKGGLAGPLGGSASSAGHTSASDSEGPGGAGRGTSGDSSGPAPTGLDQTSLAYLLENHMVVTLSSDDMRRGTDTFADWREALRLSRTAGCLDLPCCSCLIRGPEGDPLVFVMSANWAGESMLLGYAEALARTLTAARANAANERARAKAQLHDHRRFLATMSHELRTPLNAVIAFSSLAIEEGDLTPKDQEYIDSSLVSAQALLGVINQILEWSKISAVGAQTFELVQEPFTLGTLAEDLADIISMKADRGKIIVTIDCDAALRARTFIGDAFRLRQCLINLTDNAVKFSQEGKVVAVSFRQTSAPIDPTLDDAHANGSPGLSSSPSEGLRAFLNAVAMANSQRRSMSANNGTGSGSGPARVTENDNEEGTDADDTSASARRARQWVQITVLDQGEGMSPEAVKKLFKPFSQVSSTAGGRQMGTGLGLVIVKKLTELMGGNITVTSTKGKGSEFKIVVPLPMEVPSPRPSQDWGDLLPVTRTSSSTARGSDASTQQIFPLASAPSAPFPVSRSNAATAAAAAAEAAAFPPTSAGARAASADYCEWVAAKGDDGFIPVTIENGRVRRSSEQPAQEGGGGGGGGASAALASPLDPVAARRRCSVPNLPQAPRAAPPGKIVVAVGNQNLEGSLCEALKEMCGHVIVARPERLNEAAAAAAAAGAASGLPRKAPSGALGGGVSDLRASAGCAPPAGLSPLGRVPSSSQLDSVQEEAAAGGGGHSAAYRKALLLQPFMQPSSDSSDPLSSDVEVFRLGILNLAKWGHASAAVAAGFPIFGGGAARQKVLPVVMECSHLLRLCANAKEAASLLEDPRLFFITVGLMSERKLLLAAIREPAAIAKVAFVGLPFKFSVLQRTVNMLFDPALVVALPRGASVALNQNDKETAKIFPMTILVADDNATNQKVARAVLGHFGYVPEVVDDGTKAVARVMETHFDLVLMDIEMPVLDGVEATRRIRIHEESAARQPAFIVALTAHTAEDGDGDSYWTDKGFSAFLPKPINPASVRGLLKKRQMAAKLQRMTEETPGAGC